MRVFQGRRSDPQGGRWLPCWNLPRGVDDAGPGAWGVDQDRAAIQGVRVITGQAVKRISRHEKALTVHTASGENEIADIVLEAAEAGFDP